MLVNLHNLFSKDKYANFQASIYLTFSRIVLIHPVLSRATNKEMTEEKECSLY